ncbi:hypothetical protein [Nocardia barduliensis]|uniref:hypothetical protein n=1 Tax=Nocardia barduliensis TaxID=2736643 RepID=UPI001572E965|nr:hypothetical protein [Nocardia barduliensis]
METEIHANKGWQHIGKIPEAGNLYADGSWSFNSNSGEACTCKSDGTGLQGNYYVQEIRKGDPKYPYSGDEARVGQVIYRVGEQGLPEALDLRRHFAGGEDVWMRINDLDSGLGDNKGSLKLRFCSARESAEYNQRMTLTNSYGDPIGTRYTRNAAGGYDKVR